MVDAAIKIVARRGFDGASVHEIAKAAGYSTGGLYASFAGKDELFLAVYDAHAAWFEEMLAGIDVTADAATAVADAFARLDSNREQFLVFLEFWAYAVRKPKLRRELAKRMAALRASVSDRLAERERETGRPLPLPADVMALLLLAGLRGLALERLADEGAVDEKTIAALLST